MKILAIRLAAIGDVVITLPWLAGLRAMYPGATLDMLCGQEAAPLVQATPIVDHVWVLGGGRSAPRQALSAASLLPGLAARRFDVVLDLQNNRVSRLLTRGLRPRALGAFDPHGHAPHGLRVALAITQAGLGEPSPVFGLPLRPQASSGEALPARERGQPWVVLNLSGRWETRRWPLPSWVEFTRRWDALSARPPLYLCCGLPDTRARVEELARAVGPRLLDLTGRLDLVQAAALIARADLAVSEDGGLLHVAWVAGVPTVALLGSTRGDQAAPVGGHTARFDSGDLPCGYCQLRTCLHGDVRCLTRVTPAQVVEAARALAPAPSAPRPSVLS